MENLNKTYRKFLDIFCSKKRMINKDCYIFVSPTPVCVDNKLMIGFVAYNQKTDKATKETFIPLTEIAAMNNKTAQIIKKIRKQLLEELKKL